MPEFKFLEKPEWGTLATFVPNKDEPVYNWLYYKEGFAKEMVFRLAEMFSLKKGTRVLDPFCGVGTTLLACRQLGIDSIGFDVHPVAVFASKVKARDYDPELLRQEIKRLIKSKFQRPRTPDSHLLRRVFPRHTLEDAVFFREMIASNPNSRIRDFFMLGLINAAIKCSYAYKDGAVIKIKKKPVPPLREMLRRQLFRMLRDAENFKTEKCETYAEFGDARALPLEPESIDAVITSPPYLNKIEYSRIYEIEHELFLRHVQEMPAVRSYIGLSLSKLEKDFSRLDSALDLKTVQSLPPEASPYLADMFQSIEEMHRVCRKGARVGMVVGNGCFPNGVVDSDILLSRLAEQAGFKVEKILVLNKRWCLRNRTEKVGIARESLLLWEK